MDLNALFTYHPPTEEQQPLYRRLTAAYDDCVALFDQHAPVGPHDANAFEAVGAALRRFAEVLLEVCPPSDDRTAAIRCLRLARNGINAHLHAAERSTQQELGVARDELLKARWQAAAAIALDGRSRPDPAPVSRESMMPSSELFFVVDVESIGLHGEGFAVGWVLINGTGAVEEEGCAWCRPDAAVGVGGAQEEDDRAWVAANVPTAMLIGSRAKTQLWSKCASPREVRWAFWIVWRSARSRGARMVADVPWPVEARFLTDCLRDDPARTADAPYPLLDVASVRLAAGLDPLAALDRLPGETPHHPLGDARQSARLLLDALSLLPSPPQEP